MSTTELLLRIINGARPPVQSCGHAHLIKMLAIFPRHAASLETHQAGHFKDDGKATTALMCSLYS
jgi:hypothetical protein